MKRARRPELWLARGLLRLAARAWPAGHRAGARESVLHAGVRGFERRRAESRIEAWLYLAAVVTDTAAAGLAERRRRGGASRTLVHDDGRTTMTMDRIRSALRLAFRTLGRSPTFTVVAVLTLAAGVGANTAIFSLAHWALLRPVPGVSDPGELVTVEVGDAGSEGIRPVSYPTVRRLLATEGLPAAAAYSPFDADVVLAPDTPPLRRSGQLVTPGFFETLGVSPLMGRTFRPEEGDATTVHRTVVVSHRFWRETLDGDGGVLDRTLDVNGSSFAVVGVMPPDFRGPSRTADVDLWVPASAATAIHPRLPANILRMARAPLWHRTIVRPEPGTTPEALATRLERAAPEIERAGSEIRVLEGIGLSGSLRRRLTETMTTLGVLVSLLLVLTAANLANLVLSRVGRRRHEASVRKAMGASASHLTIDLVAEGVLLAAAGSVFAVATGWGLLRLVEGTQVLAWFPEVKNVPLDLPVLLFALAAAAGTVGAATVMAAGRLRRLHPGSALQSRGTSDGSPRLLRRGLVSVQVALSLGLVVAASLMARSLDRLFESELGFDPEGVVTFSLNPGVQGYQDTEADRLFRELAVEIGALPEVEAVGFSWLAPLGRRRYGVQVRALGRDAEDDAVAVEANMVTPDFFQALGTSVESGRTFDDREYEEAMRPDRGDVVLNRRLAERLFPGEEAVGKQIRMDGRHESSFEVVGVVEDARLGSVQEPAGPALFDPFGNGYRTTSAAFVVRTVDQADPEALVARLEALVHERDPRLPLLEAGTLHERVRSAVSTERALGRLVGTFAFLSLVLAAVGLFGLISESVQARIREFGIRTALGARSGQVAGLVMKESLLMVGAGVILGFFLARWAAGFLESRLFGLPPLDPASFAAATAILVAVVLAASVTPAWRSTRVDPAEALRSE